MGFKAKGKLIDFDTRRGEIVAVMHEGFLGLNHRVTLKLDPKFVADVISNLKHEYVKGGIPGSEISRSEGGELAGIPINGAKLGSKELTKHKIKIVID